MHNLQRERKVKDLRCKIFHESIYSIQLYLMFHEICNYESRLSLIKPWSVH